MLWFWAAICLAHDPCKLAPEALKIAAELRGLPLKSPVECRLLKQQPFKKLLEELIREDLDVATLEREQKIFGLIGLIPDEYQYAKCLVDAYAVESAAFYNSKGKYFAIPDWMPTSLAVLVHEATHALQDQYFDLGKMDKSKTLFSDEYLATSALIEGDALWVEKEFRKRFPQSAGYEPTYDDKIELKESSCKVPDSLEQLFYFEYDFGYELVERLRNAGGIKALDDAFRSPPRRTRPILHAKDSASLEKSELGEFIVRTLLLRWSDPKSAVRGAAGLVSDEIQLVGNKVIWKTKWDSENDSREFMHSYGKRFGLEVNPAARWVKFNDKGIEGEIRASGDNVIVQLEHRL